MEQFLGQEIDIISFFQLFARKLRIFLSMAQILHRVIENLAAFNSIRYSRLNHKGKTVLKNVDVLRSVTEFWFLTIGC